MIDVAIFIPAQESNKYHELGDIAPFGDTTLLNWKISQCKEFVPPSQIFVSSCSVKIKEISEKEGVNHVMREADDGSVEEQLNTFSSYIGYGNILWVNATSPFLGGREYASMLKNFSANKSCNLLISTIEKYEYTFFENEKVNFQSLTPRAELKPVNICTNGAFLMDRKSLIDQNGLHNMKDVCFHNLDIISSTEIKDIDSYSIAQNLITVYFSRLLGSANV